MRVAFIYDAVYPWEKGGAQKRIWELARRLAEDHDVHLYGMHYWDGPRVVEREGVTLHGVCEPMELYTDGRRSIPQAIQFAFAVLRSLRGEKFDVVDCQEFPYFPCYAAKLHQLLTDSSLVITWYEVWDDYWFDYLGPRGAFGWFVERGTTLLPDEFVPISPAIADDLDEIQLRDNQITVVPNGVDFEAIQSVEPASEDWDVVYVGRLAEHKNVDVLIDAVELAAEELDRPVRCGIVGDGPERSSLKRHAVKTSAAASITFLGFLEDHDEVISHLSAGTVFVLPSTREGFPNTILEANACGVPSIVVEHPENGATAVVEDGKTGFVTELSASAIASRLETLLNDSDRRETMSEAARTFAATHDWSRIVEQLETVYEKHSDSTSKVESTPFAPS